MSLVISEVIVLRAGKFREVEIFANFMMSIVCKICKPHEIISQDHELPVDVRDVYFITLQENRRIIRL